jgi:myosin heavy subunit
MSFRRFDRNSPEGQASINALIASSFVRSLKDLKVSLALVQAACAFALEGTTRATASQVATRAVSEYGIEVTASFTGQVFSALKVSTATSHGKSRFILECNQLEEIRKEIVSQCSDLSDKLEATLQTFDELPERISLLEATWKEVVGMRTRERELINAINEARKIPSRLGYLEAEAEKVRRGAARTAELEKECRALSRKVKRLPSLDDRKKSLKEAIEQHEAKEKKLAEREQDMVSNEESVIPREAIAAAG